MAIPNKKHPYENTLVKRSFKPKPHPFSVVLDEDLKYTCDENHLNIGATINATLRAALTWNGIEILPPPVVQYPQPTPEPTSSPQVAELEEEPESYLKPELTRKPRGETA